MLDYDIAHTVDVTQTSQTVFFTTVSDHAAYLGLFCSMGFCSVHDASKQSCAGMAPVTANLCLLAALLGGWIHLERLLFVTQLLQLVM